MGRKTLTRIIGSLVISLGVCSPSLGGESAEISDIPPPKTYVTAATCGTCHPKQYTSYMRSAHQRRDATFDDARQFCGQCHGDAVNHVLKRGGRGVEIFAFSSDTAPQEKSARCLSCHYRSPDLRLWEMGVHERQGVSCNDCHTIHQLAPTRAKEEEACFTCHRRVKVEANKRSHHPILENRLQCSSCHQVHGTLNQGLVRAIDSQMLCYSCHAEKRGPAVWIHPPVEENCQTCHRPHGSIHANLLVDRVPQLCKNCHDWSRYPGSPYAETAGSGSGRCSQNHPAIHGSSVPSGGGQRLSR